MLEKLQKKKLPLALTVGAGVLLLGGGIAAYWLFTQHKPDLKDAPVGFQVIPQDALLTASISTNSAQWQQLQLYGTPETKDALDKQLTQLRDNLLAANGFNYEQDIQRFLGKTVAIAYLGSKPPVTGATPNQVPLLGSSFLPDLIVLPMENSTQAQQLFDKTKSQKATQFFERTYKGILIRETHKSNAQNFSLALLGRFVVVTNHPKFAERVIDTYKGAASVAATPGYLAQLPKIKVSNPFAQLYLNVPAFSASLAANSSAADSPEKVAASQPMQGITSTVTLEPQGVRFQGISWLKANSDRKQRVENTSSRLPRRLPADTLMMIAGGNLAQWWQNTDREKQSNPLLPIKPDSLSAGLKATLGLDFEKDFLPWMKDEFSLALVPAPPEVLTRPENQMSPPLGAGVVLMVEASDRNRADATLKQLDRIMATRYGFQVAETKLKEKSVITWTSRFGGITTTRTWLEGNVVFLTFGAPIASAMLPEPRVPLIQSPLFQQAVPTQPNPNNGQFFLDVERTINSSNLYLPQFLSSDQKLVAKAIRAIGFTQAIQDRRTTRFNLFVQLKTAVILSPTPMPDSSAVTPGSSLVPQSPQKPQISPSSPSTPQTAQTPSSSPSASPNPQRPPS